LYHATPRRITHLDSTLNHDELFHGKTLIPFTLAWLIGIWLASRIAAPLVALGVATIVAVVGIILTWRTPKPTLVFILTLAAILGALRYNLGQPHFDQTSLATYNDQQKLVIVEGVVVGEPDARDTYTNLRVEVGRLIITDQPTRTVKGLVLVQAPPFTDYRYGDRIRAEGKLQTPTNTGDFDYREYLARQDVYSTPHLRWVQVSCRAERAVLVRDQGFAPTGVALCVQVRGAKNVITQILPRTASVAAHGHFYWAMMLVFHKSLQEAFRITGHVHILAISG